jgi:hypothetical protein
MRLSSSPHAAIRNRTEAWGEGAPLTAQVESVRMAVPSARTRFVHFHVAGAT